MGKRKIKNPAAKKAAGKPEAQRVITPEGRQLQRKAIARQEDDFTVYQMVKDGKLDLLQKYDYTHMSTVARELGWSRGRLDKAVDRIWNTAKQDLANEDRRNKARDNAQIQSRDGGRICDSSDDTPGGTAEAPGREGDGHLCEPG